MRPMLLAIVVGACALAVSGGSIAAGDRELFVAPPESVAENFARNVLCGRYTPALQHVTRGSTVGEAGLRHLREELQARTGDVVGVEGKPEAHDPNHAVATAVIDGASGTTVLRMSMRFERREWQIEAWSMP
jgi:hypothetical protein